MNSVERQQVWNRRIHIHCESCEQCGKNIKCPVWVGLIHAYNTAAPPDATHWNPVSGWASNP